MKLYNTLTKSKEELVPSNNKKFTFYACGPTVYNYAHIGNLRTYINADILRRSLKYLGYEVEEVMNITDIEDKIIKTANEQGVDYHEITGKYEKAFLADLKKLNIETPEHMPRATEEIDGMIAIISKLLETGFAYKSEDGSIYFSISKSKEYGKLAHLDFAGLKDGARVSQDEYEKESVQDFALWKAKKEGEPSWPASFGEGRPGWHIECSAMSMKYLGDTIDIHSGAVDLVFPHHENEIAQSEAYTGKKFVKYWFHGEHLMVNGKKMSKSLGNLFTLDDVCTKFKVEPLSLRMLSLMSHYREVLNFTDKSIIQAQNTLDNMKEFVLRLKGITKEGDEMRVDSLILESKKQFKRFLDDDLGMPNGLASIFTFIKEVNKLIDQGINITEAKEVINFMEDMDRVLGLGLSKIESIQANEEINIILEKRRVARLEKNWSESDRLREEVRKLGFDIEDSVNGQVLTNI